MVGFDLLLPRGSVWLRGAIPQQGVVEGGTTRSERTRHQRSVPPMRDVRTLRLALGAILFGSNARPSRYPYHLRLSAAWLEACKIPAHGTENDDHSPPRSVTHHSLDVSVGHDNLLHGDKYKWESPGQCYQPDEQDCAV